MNGPVAATSTTAYGFAGVSVSAAGGRGGVVEYNSPTFGVWPAPGAVGLSSTREAAFYFKHTSHSLGDWVRYVAGGGNDFSEDAGHLSVNFGSSTAVMAEGPQGIFYLEKEARVRLLKPDGGVSTVAGDINYGFAGDGLPATQGRFNYARTLATDPSGNLYIGDVENYRIRRVDAVTGLLSTVVGNGQRGFSPDGTLATEAKLDGLSDIMVGHDGHLYFMADASPGMTLRRVENGVLTTVAGGNIDNRPPWESSSPKGIYFRGSRHWLAQGIDGTLYIAGYDSGDGVSDFVVRSIEADGRVRLLAGAGTSTDPNETEARRTCFSGMSGMKVAHDGTIYVGETGGTGCGLRGPGVRAIYPDGAFSLFFGGVSAATTGYLPPDGPAALSQLNGVGDLILRTDGGLLVMHRGAVATLHEIALPRSSSRLVPSRDGEEVYVFDRRGRHLRTVSARTGLQLWQFTWGAQGLVSITDVDGDVTTVERSADVRARALVAQDGQRTEVTVNAASGLVERITDPMGRFVEAAYLPGRGLLSEWKDANGNATAFTWDDVGNLATHTNALGAKKAYQALPGGGGVEFTSPEGRLTQYRREIVGGGVLLTMNPPDGTQTTRAYGSGIQHHYGSDGTYVEIEMQGGPTSRFGRLVDVPGKVKVRTPAGLEFSAISVRSSTNAPNDSLAVTEEIEETRVNGRLWLSRYDGVGKTYQVTSPLGRMATGTLNTKLRPVTVSEPGVLPITYAYDSRGRLESQTQGVRSETFSYDSNGFLDSARNALNEVTRFAVDKSGRLQKTTRADAKEIGLEQDPVGNFTGVTVPDGGIHLFSYDQAHQVTTYAPPSVPGVANEMRAYDLDGLVTRTGHSDSSQTVVTREQSGRVTQITTPWWVNDFTYVPATGRVQTLTRGVHRLEWLYDGFLMKEERAIGLATSQWTYDSNFRRSTHTINGAAITYGYDGDSLLTQVGAAILTRVPATGQLSTVTVGSVVTTVTPNQYGELATLAATASAAPLYSEGLSYDAAGRITVVEEVIQGAPVQWVYGYDKVGQLISASKNGAPATTWTYDGNGNRLTQDGVASTFDAQDRLKAKGTATFEWDALGGRLTKTEGGAVTRYVHDGLGALISVTLPGLTHFGYRDYDAGAGAWTARDPIGLEAGLNAFVYSTSPIMEIDPSGLTLWKQAFLVLNAGIRTGKQLSEKAAKAFLRKGGNVVTKDPNAAKRVAKQLSKDAGGSGACTKVESHGPQGAKHVHPSLNTDGTKRPEGIGHIFIDTDLMLIPGIFFDADGDGTWFEVDDAAEWVNPSPISTEQWKAIDPFGFQRAPSA